MNHRQLRRFAALVGVAGLTAAAQALPAGAAPFPPAASLTAATTPTVAAGPHSAAGDLIVSNLGAVAEDARYDLELVPPAGASCGSGTDGVTIVDRPTVVGFDHRDLRINRSADGCQLQLEFERDFPTAPALRITGINLHVGADVPEGLVAIKAAGGPAPQATIAEVSDVLAAVTVGTLLAPSTTDQALLGDLTLTEVRAGALTEACATLQGPAGATFGTGATVTAPAGATASAVTRSANGRSLSFTVSTPTAAPGTFALRGLSVSTTANRGQARVVVEKGACGSGAATVPAEVSLGVAGRAGARIEGADRYATARQIAAQHPSACHNDRVVVIARGDDFPDALAASYVAGKQNSVVLLTASDHVPQPTIDALGDLNADEVVLIGGTEAISEQVAEQLSQLYANDCAGNPSLVRVKVQRVAGANRFDTAAKAAQFDPRTANPADHPQPAGPPGTVDLGFDGTNCDAVRTAIVASGAHFADALAAGGLAYGGVRGSTAACGRGAIPLLLTGPEELAPETQAALESLEIRQVILMGGPVAVSESVRAAIEATTVAGGPISVVRIAGENRWDTAAQLNARLTAPASGGFGAAGFLVARGDSFPDALAASSLAGKERPLYLSESPDALGTTTSAAIVHTPQVVFTTYQLLGGADALRPAVATQADAAMGGQAIR